MSEQRISFVQAFTRDSLVQSLCNRLGTQWLVVFFIYIALNTWHMVLRSSRPLFPILCGQSGSRYNISVKQEKGIPKTLRSSVESWSKGPIKFLEQVMSSFPKPKAEYIMITEQKAYLSLLY
jgi:hypothetical protein